MQCAEPQATQLREAATGYQFGAAGWEHGRGNAGCLLPEGIDCTELGQGFLSRSNWLEPHSDWHTLRDLEDWKEQGDSPSLPRRGSGGRIAL